MVSAVANLSSLVSMYTQQQTHGTGQSTAAAVFDPRVYKRHKDRKLVDLRQTFCHIIYKIQQSDASAAVR